ncbi:DUF3853 domain-containing protein [Elizabethkingia anophelis]|jgi:hypothetical protein|nr:DUF3853 family protein [Elizabethkingia anophelis]HAY3555735.1 DUF3853 family protein [Elizabethkingia meningoseptica]AQW92534.1 hypothetical protein BBD28_04985 [Elizabethkingia anophelis]MCL1034644.1 DUF3853 family protein [Elizabethkingia anophelis]MDV3854091.1 DUF3853 domain-containing protein [Elizabethkingia anophelis]MDV3861046.1 DUF3853 domain-containing protein [Elizabethkingia anophelis]
MIPKELRDKPFFSMTGSEIVELFNILLLNKEAVIERIERDYTQKELIHGIKGLAELLGCGRTKAQELKSSGILKEAVIQNGKKIIFDAAKVLELLKNQQ